MMLRILIWALLFSAGASLAGNLYRWVDSDGTVHYSDQPPSETVKDVQQKKLSANVIAGSPGYELLQAVKNFPVTLYSSDCGEGCNKAHQLLNRRGIPYSEKNPILQPENAEALKKVAGELLVPVLVVGSSQTLKGFEENAWNNALDAAGYPKIAVPAFEAPKTATKPAANIPPPPGMSATPAAPKSNY